MSLKQELQTWSDALQAYEREDYDTSLALFASIAESSRIHFNIGIIYATLGAHEQAVASFAEAFSLDQYLAIAYFQSGVSHFLLTRYDEALKDFEDAYTYLRGNIKIDYDQLGLKYQLYSCEILFNRGLCLLNRGQEREGMQDLETARMEKQTDVHGVIDEAIADQGAGYTVFSIPVGILYRPAEAKLKNLKPKNYLGSAKLIAASDAKDAFTGFTGRTLAEIDGTLPPRRGPSSTGPNRELDRVILAGRGRTGSSSSAVTPPVALRRRPSDMTAALTLPSSANSSPRQNSPIKTGRSAASSRYDPTAPPTSVAPLSYGRRPKDPPPLPSNIVPLLTPPQSRNGSRSALSDYEEVNELYDSYTNGGLASFERPIEDQDLRAPSGQPKKRTEEWARTAPTGAPLTASPEYDAASRRSESVADSRATASSVMNRIRLKLHYNQSVRGMSISPEIPRDDFYDLVLTKFSISSASMYFVDEDGSQIDIIDDSDWDSAIDAARELGGGRSEGKLSVWIR